MPSLSHTLPGNWRSLHVQYHWWSFPHPEIGEDILLKYYALAIHKESEFVQTCCLVSWNLPSLMYHARLMDLLRSHRSTLGCVRHRADSWTFCCVLLQGQIEPCSPVFIVNSSHTDARSGPVGVTFKPTALALQRQTMTLNYRHSVLNTRFIEIQTKLLG